MISIFLLCAGIASASTVVNRGTFALPKTGVKWRYWIEDASVDPDVLRSDVAEMARVGSSGFQLLSYQSYGSVGDNTGLILLDPTDFAFGSDTFVDATATAVQAAMDSNLTIDFTLGPDQGAGIPVFPTDIDMDGMNTELVFGSQFLEPTQTFDGPIPSPTIFPFLRFDGTIASANISTMQLVGVIGAQLVPGANTTSDRVSLDFNTVEDLTSQVQTMGNISTLSWTPSSNGTSVVLSYFSRRNGYPEARPGFDGALPNKPGSWGSWVVDHFSPKGVNISTSFIQNNILANQNVGEMLALPGVGQYMWEDSMEFHAQLFWTDGFSERFIERHGYEPNITLPVLHSLRGVSFVTGTLPNQTFDYGTTFNWAKFTEDYQDTLTSLYIDYMASFSEWSRSIGMSFSNQPGYNFDLDVAASAAIPDTPEIESLGVPTIDEARQLSGGVHLGNRTIFSSETGARPGEANALRMAELLQDSNTQFAAGVNVVMLHGFPYSGDYPNTTWPGITTFGYNFADMHGPRMPAWDHYKEYLDYLARTQYALQAGVAKVDVAIYHKAYNLISPTVFASTSLISSGYTYEYVSPENLKLPGVSVSDSRLAPLGPAYKAFILNRQQNITVDAAQSLLDYAQSGLPVVILGQVPNDIPGFEQGNSGMTQVQALMSQLTAEPSVVVVDDEADVPVALASLGVVPAVSANPPSSTLYSIVRRVDDAETSTAYFFLFNQGSTAINYTLTLNPGFNGIPFVLNAWTGEVDPVALYSADSGNISIPSISLAPSQTALFAVTDAQSLEGVPAPSNHLVSADSSVAAVRLNSSGAIELRSEEDGATQITLSNGQTMTANFSLEGAASVVLDGWQLNITAWTPPQNLSDHRSVLVPLSPINLTQGLVPWTQLEGFENTSGVGTYVSSFEWQGDVGALLDFGAIFHTVKAWLNGEQVATADPTNPIVDVSNLVENGTNSIRIDAASTLLNAINAVPQVESLGQLRTSVGTIPPDQQYGLISNVTVIPYARVTISL